MKKFTLLAMVAMFFMAPANAQMQLPALSPRATVTQTVGLTDVTIEFSSPAVRDREIWGGLVPHDELWRAGANQATKITFSRDVTIGGKNVPAGSYSILMIPARNTFTVIFNKVPTASTANYQQSEDVVRVEVQPRTIAHRERLVYLVSDFTNDEANIDMEWERTKVSVPVKFNTHDQAMAGINNNFSGIWRQYAVAANYLLNAGKDIDQGIEWINESISMRDDWYNNWIKAQLLREKGDHAGAYQHAEKARELGEKSENFFFRSQVNDALKTWRKN